MRTRRPALLTASLAAAALALSACGGGASADGSDAGASGEAVELHLGYFPNLTHAPALVGVKQRLFEGALADVNATVVPTVFNAGPDAITALFGGSLDITYIGPNPTINAYVQSGGQAVRVIAGAASGGASLVVRPGIASAADLAGKTIATPQLGNTQDVALRNWLQEQGFTTNAEGGGDVNIKPQSNAEGLAAYAAGSIDGAWVPEPWVSEYLKAGATVLVDERDLWPDGAFVTTNVIVRTEFLQQHPDVVEAFLKAHVAAVDSIADNPAQAKQDVIDSIAALTGTAPDPAVVDQAWTTVAFTEDPLPATLVASAAHAVSVGLLDQAGIDAAGGLPGTLYDLGPLNKVLVAMGMPEIAQP